MHAISSYRGNRPTPKHRPLVANKHTGLITIHCAAKLSAQCKNLQTPSSGKIICFSNQVLVSYFCSYEILLSYPLRRTAVHINSLFNKTTTTIFRLDALALSVIATATWLAGWLGVHHSRYCIKTTKPIRKLFGPSGRHII